MLDVNCNQTPVAIANPTAGTKNRKGISRVWFSKLPANTHVKVSSSPEETEEIAKHASLLGCPMIIAVGGDGTIHRVLNGIMQNHSNRSCMGIIAEGTANDYGQSLEAYRAKHPNNSLLVDVGRLRWGDQVRFFANVAGIGLPSRVARHADNLRGFPARVRYALAVLRCLGAGLATEAMEVLIDDGNEGPYRQEQLLMMSIAIGTREGSFEMAAQARFDDGLFDTLQVGKLSRLDILCYLPGVLRGKIPTKDSRISTGTCRKIKLRSASPISMHLDGEIPDGKPREITECELEVMPQHLSVQVL